MLSGRDSAPLVGLPSGGMVRADGPARLPMVRMTNVGLLPGDSSLDEMIAGTEDGIYMSTNRSWSIDDKRLNFQFGCEIGWEIKDGALGRMVRNPTYTGIGPTFWAVARRRGRGRRVDRVGPAHLRQGPAAPGRPHGPPRGAVPLPRRAGGRPLAGARAGAGSAPPARPGDDDSDSTRAGSSWIDVELVEALARRVGVGHVLELPRVGVGQVGGVAAELDHRQHVRLHRVADHEEAVGLDAD